MAEIVNLGSLYLNGQPIDLGVEYNGEVLSFGNTIPGKTIPFVKWGKLLVASQCVCTNISWDELNKAGYIFGRPVKINGTPYICRSLKVGEMEGAPNEWDAILNDLGEDDSLWHWMGKYFWGQEAKTPWRPFRAVRGYSSARRWCDFESEFQNVNVGFRPVLEQLPPDPLLTDSSVGHYLIVYGPDGSIAGELVEFSDYDLVMQPSAWQKVDPDCKWASIVGNNIVIDKTAVVWIEKGWGIHGRNDSPGVSAI